MNRDSDKEIDKFEKDLKSKGLDEKEDAFGDRKYGEADEGYREPDEAADGLEDPSMRMRFDEGGNERVDEIHDVTYRGKGENAKRIKRSQHSNRGKVGSMLWAAAFLVAGVVLAMSFIGGSTPPPDKDINEIKAQLVQLEKKIIYMEGLDLGTGASQGMKEELARIVEQVRSLQTAVAKLKKSAPPKGSTRAGVASPKKKTGAKKARGFYTIKKGDTLYSISKRYGLSVSELCRFNNMTDRQILEIGQKLRLAP